jgi:4-aminobutyrate aminotransferase-like enzyme
MGATVRDLDGNIYIDLTGGQHTASTGHSHPKVIKAISEAAVKGINSAQWPHIYRYEAAKKIVEICPSNLNRVVFQHSGTEGTSHAIRLARHFTKKDDIISLGHYHGKGYLGYPWRGGMAPPGREIRAPGSNCYRCTFKLEYPECGLRCAEYVGEVIKSQSFSRNGVRGEHNVAAVIMEPFAGGFMPNGYLPKLKNILEENEVLLIADEIKIGFGRTGKWWGCDWDNIVPDIICASKGIASGVPAAAIIGSAEMWDSMPDSCEVHSFTGNPIVCAGISATIDMMKEMKIIENAAKVGDYMRQRLLEMQEDHELIGNPSCKGLFFRIELVKDRKTKELATEATEKIFIKAFEKGLLTYGSGFWTPPLVLTRAQAGKGLDLLEESFKEYERET